MSVKNYFGKLTYTTTWSKIGDRNYWNRPWNPKDANSNKEPKISEWENNCIAKIEAVDPSKTPMTFYYSETNTNSMRANAGWNNRAKANPICVPEAADGDCFKDSTKAKTCPEGGCGTPLDWAKVVNPEMLKVLLKRSSLNG